MHSNTDAFMYVLLERRRGAVVMADLAPSWLVVLLPVLFVIAVVLRMRVMHVDERRVLGRRPRAHVTHALHLLLGTDPLHTA